jgi:succinate dehydrogenase / fumarate reductase cytochrome b subunit
MPHASLKSKDQRPVNLALHTIKFPVTAILSILHRITGFVLFLAIPIFLYFLQYSLTDHISFEKIKNGFNCGIFKFLLWLLLTSLYLHLVAGIKHILMDLHLGDSKKISRLNSYVSFVLVAIVSVITGVCIW